MNKRVLVAIEGYGNTGASVVTDYLREFRNISTIKMEFQLLNEPDGILDLYHALVESNSRIGCNTAIKRFLKNSKNYRHTMYFSKGKRYFVNLCKDYINSLYPVSWKGYSFLESNDVRGCFDSNCTRFFNRALNKIVRSLNPKNGLPINSKRYFAIIDRQTFINKTRVFLNKVLELIGLDKDIVVLEQAFPSTNPKLGAELFDMDVVHVVVERDIRDVFCETNLINRADNRYMPCNCDIESYLRYYQYIIDARNRNKSEDVIYLKFEDFVTNAAKYISIINERLHLTDKDHVFPQKFFDPNKSIKNVGIYKKFPKYNAFFEKCANKFPDMVYNDEK